MSSEQEQRQIVWNRVGGVWGRCEDCGQRPDWRGLQIAHTPPKGMGGTTRAYSADPTAQYRIRAVCGRCHGANDHHLSEA